MERIKLVKGTDSNQRPCSRNQKKRSRDQKKDGPALSLSDMDTCNSIRTISSRVLKKIPSSVIYIWSSVLGSAHPSICMKRHMRRGIGLEVGCKAACRVQELWID